MFRRLFASPRALLAIMVCLVVLSSVTVVTATAASQPRSPIATLSTAMPVTTATTQVTATQAVPAVGTAVVPPTSPPTTAKPEVPVFESAVTPIDEVLEQQMLDNEIWRSGAPVALDELRVIRVSHWDFDGRVQTGRVVVNRAWAVRPTTVFRALFEARFPIRRMDPVDSLGQNGDGMVASDNTESFQARTVNGGWSMHARGLAVDINPAENPWVRGRSVIPAAGAAFTDRSVDAPGLVRADSVVVRAFEAIGWKWGGEWNSSKDYMHFSSNGH